MVKYTALGLAIPQGSRKAINDKIIALLDGGDMQGITAQDIFNSYTGAGGLHNLSFGRYSSFHDYTEAKKEIEQGQFFTPASIAQRMASLIGEIKPSEAIADLTSGAGIFCNYFPEQQFYGCEIDTKAYKISRHLYPDANFECKDIRYYNPDIRFNYVIGNPPFNLTWTDGDETVKSQDYYFKKAAEMLRPGGLVLAIVPASFCADEFSNAGQIEAINDRYNFLFQIALEGTAFQPMGVEKFDTKIIALQCKSQYLPEQPYNLTFCTFEEGHAIMQQQIAAARLLAVKINAEDTPQTQIYRYKVTKYLYEIKTHFSIQSYYNKALAYIEKRETQKCPDNMNYAEWHKKHFISENDVLYYLRRIVRMQSKKQENVIRPVKTTYGFRLKAYSNKAQHRLNTDKGEKYWHINDLVYNNYFPKELPQQYQKLITRKRAAFLLQDTPINQIEASEKVRRYLEKFRWENHQGTQSFNEKQKDDLARVLTKSYTILNWQQGSGKTSAAFAWALHQAQPVTFIVSTALAINLTWSKFLTTNNQEFIKIQSLNSVDKIGTAPFVLVSHEYMIKYERHIKKSVKMLGKKIALILDESDEITNHLSKRTRAIKSCFQRASHKLLTTGTTTRNNIAELYTQLELLYNNSINMRCDCPTIYVEDKKEERIKGQDNPRYGLPFPAYRGNTLFKQCFNPSRSSVFGIQQHDQSIYNEDHLRALVEKTIITRKFRELAGDKYTVENVATYQSPAERHVYRLIVKEFHSILYHYFNRTGNARKDSMLAIIRQLMLLIEASSTPHLLSHYEGTAPPNKALDIFRDLAQITGTSAVGCTSIKAVEWYADEIRARFPNRPLFVITGDVPFKKRDSLIEQFQKSKGGIIVCTQQSLRSSVNIPECDEVLIESLQWNIPKMEQFYFRFIRYDSKRHTRVRFYNYHDTIEANLLALLMAKEKLNDYIKTLETKDSPEMFAEFGIDMSILETIITKERDEDGNVTLRWGQSDIT